MIYRPLFTALFAVLLLASTHSSRAGNWAQWRGPHFNGATTEKNLPTTFSQTEGVLWKTPMPGPSGSTPVIWDDRVFVSSTDESARICVAMALDRKTGEVVWHNKVTERMYRDRRSTFSNPSPVTDGRHVWFFYGTGDLVCYDVSGRKIWQRNIEEDYGQFAFQWTFSSTPVLYEGRLYLQVLQRDVAVHGRGGVEGQNYSYLLALDPKTGKELWKVVRPSKARAESLEAFTTPTPYEHNGRKELLIVGGDCLTGHDLATGKESWRWGTWNPTRIGHWRLVPSPVVGAGVALACGPKKSPVYAVKLGGDGNLNHSALAWQSYVQGTEDETKAGRSLNSRGVSTDVPTPLFYQGRFYVLNGQKQELYCIEPSGRVVWSGELGGNAKIEASPTGADGKIYVMDFVGDVFVVRAGGDKFDLLHKASMGERGENNLRSCVVPSHGQLFVRTSKHLFCIAKK